MKHVSSDLHHNINFLCRFAQSNFQRSQVSHEKLYSFGSLLNRLVPKIEKQIEEDDMKTIVEIIGSTLANFTEIGSSHQVDYGRWNEYLYNVIHFYFHAINAYLNKKSKRITEILDIFWPFYAQTLTQGSIEEVQKKIIKMQFLAEQSLNDFQKKYTEKRPDLSANQERIVLNFLLRENKPSTRQTVRYLIQDVLSFYNDRNRNCIESLLIMGELFIAENRVPAFKKFLDVYVSLSASPDEYCHNIQILVNRILKSNNVFIFMKKLSQEIGLEKVYTSEEIFKIGMMILKKIFQTQFQRDGTTPDFVQNQLPQALKIIDKYIFLINSVKNFDQKSIKNLPKLIIKFILRLKRNLGGKNRSKEKKYPQFDLEKAQYKQVQGNQQAAKNFFDLKKSMAADGQFNQTQIASFNNLTTPATDILSKILHNLLKNKEMKKVLQFSPKQTFQILQDEDLLNHPALCTFAMEIFPFLTKEVNVNIGEKNALIMRIMIRVAELQCINSSEQAFQKFKTYHKMLKKPEKTNCHFVVTYLFLKYVPSSLRNQVIDYFVQQILQDCKKAQQNTKQIQLNLVLLHDFVQLRVNSKIKILVKHFLKNYKALANPLQLKQCVAIGARDCLQLAKETREQQKFDFIESAENSEVSSKAHKQQVQPLCFEVPDNILRMMREVNSKLENFKKDNLNLLYTVIIEMNKICIAAKEGFQPPRFIAYIVMMQETSLISSLSIILNNSKLILTKNIEKDNIIAAYHYLLKLDLSLKEKKQQKAELVQVESAIDYVCDFVLKLNQKQQIPSEALLQVYLDNRATAAQMKLKRDTFERKFLNYLIESQMVTFYSQADIQLSKIYVALTVKSLEIISSLQKLKEKIMKQIAVQANPAIQEENSKLDSLRNLQLLYAGNQIMEKFKQKSDKRFTLSQLQLCRTYLASVILKNYQKRTQNDKDEKDLLKWLVQDIEKNPQNIVKLSVKQKSQDAILLPNLDSFNFIDFLTTQILKQSSQQKNKQQYLNYLSILKTILDSSAEIRKSTKQNFGSKIAKQLEYIVVSRTKTGLLLTKPQERTEFSQISKNIFELFAELVHQQQHDTIKILKALKSFDSMEAIETSKFIINEMKNVTPLIEKKTENITDLIFEYTMGLKQSYPQKYISLQLPNFIADFFEIAKIKFNQDDLKALQRSQKSLVCSNQQPSYKCLKCGDRGLICLGCALGCHKDHPIIYIQGIARGNQKFCVCKDNKANRCKYVGTIVSKKQEKAPRKTDLESIFSQGLGVGMFSRQGILPMLAAERSSRMADIQIQRRMIEQGRLQILDGSLEEQRRMRIGYAPQKYTGRRYQRIDRDDQQMFFERIARPSDQRVYQRISIQANEEDKVQQLPVLNSLVSVEDEVFEPEQYLHKPSLKIMEVEKETEQNVIQSRSYYLPIFLQMTSQICEQRQAKNINQNFSSQITWKMALEQPFLGKCYGQSWKMTNNGSYPTKYRKDNPLQGKSAVVSRRTIICKGKYFMVGYNMNVFIYPKQKILTYIMENKSTLINFPPTNQQNLGVDAHSFDFSPIDDNVFCAAGLHILYFYSISGDRAISRNTAYFQVPGQYINKIKFTKLGVFLSTTRQIKLVSTNGKQVMSIRAPGQPLIKQWCCYEKQTSCTIYIVTPDGNIYFGDVDSYDQGKKTFFNMVNDPRKKRQVGASIFVKDTCQAGKVLVASFKDGSNIIGRLEDNQLQDSSFINLKPLFDKNFIMGHIDFAKTNSNKEFNIICTLKPSFTNQMTIHQGILTIIKVQKNNKIEVQQVNSDHRCETFCVIPIGEKWALVSLHQDGSLFMTLSGKISKNVIQEQIKSIKQAQNVNENVNNEKIDRIRATIKEKLSTQILKSTELVPSNHFRQFSALAKVNTQYAITKINESQFEVKYLNFSKIITGFTVPAFGNVKLLTRTVTNSLQIGLSNLQALFFYAQGSFTFTYHKNEAQKYFRDMAPARIVQRMPDGMNPNQFNERIWMKKKFEAISMEEKDIKSDIIECFSDSFDSFKTRLPKFDQIFSLKDQQNGPQSQLKKAVQILRIFLKNVIETENYDLFTQGAVQILQFVGKIRKVLIFAQKTFYKKLKQVTIMALQIHAHINGKDPDPVNDAHHGLRYATQGKLDYLYSLMKGDTTQDDLKQTLFFLREVLEDNQDLFVYYIAKYPSLLAKIHKKMKKLDQQGVVRSLFDIYVAGYPVLQQLSYNSSWIPVSICTIFSTHKDRQTRQDLFDSLIKYSKITTKAWAKTVNAIDAEESKKQVDLPVENPVLQENDAFDYEAQLSMLGNIQDEAQYERMILRISQMEYEQQRLKQEKAMQIQQQGEQQELQKQQQRDMVPVQQEMQPEIASKVIKGLIQTGMRSLQIGEDVETAASRISMLYVIFKVADVTEHQIIDLLLTKLKKFLMNITPIKDIKSQTTTMLYMSLFGECLGSSKCLKEQGLQNFQLYKQIKAIIIDVLNTIPMDQVKKTHKLPNLLAKMFKGVKVQSTLHISYGLISILHPPCQPDPVLLTLKCYWLFPQKKQYYKRIKYENAMNQAMKAYNLKKLKDIAFKNPKIWRDIADLDWVQQQMLLNGAKRQDCQILMDLMDLYYEDSCQKQPNNSNQEKMVE